MTASKLILDRFVLALGTGFYIGMIPPHTATIATALGIPLAMLLYLLVGWWGYLPVLVGLWLIGVPICGRSAELLGKADPREVTYDEYTTLPLVYFLAPDIFSWKILAAGFVLHRIFDISKMLGVGRLELMHGGKGIMADDILAATYALAVMHGLYFWGVL